MKGVFIDTSVWIDFFNGFESEEANLLTGYVEDDVPVYICSIVLQEILQGLKKDKDFNIAKDILLEYPFLQVDHIDAAIGAAKIYRTLRKKGKTIRKSNDCLIAYYAIEHNIPILHKDRDFTVISQLTNLKVIKISN